LRSAARLGDRFQQLTSGLDDLGNNAAARFRQDVDAVNDLAKKVAALDKEITQAQGAGAAPNELLDRRDQPPGELTRRAAVRVRGQEGGHLSVSLGGMMLVQDGEAAALAVSPGDSVALVRAADGEAVPLSSGELRAEQEYGG